MEEQAILLDKTTQESGYNYYDIYYKSGAWNSGRFDLRVRGGSGTLVFEAKGTNLNSLPEGCTEVLDTTYSGTASNAVKLATPRTIMGQSSMVQRMLAEIYTILK